MDARLEGQWGVVDGGVREEVEERKLGVRGLVVLGLAAVSAFLGGFLSTVTWDMGPWCRTDYRDSASAEQDAG